VGVVAGEVVRVEDGDHNDEVEGSSADAEVGVWKKDRTSPRTRG
jgi:hypothetical protein